MLITRTVKGCTVSPVQKAVHNCWICSMHLLHLVFGCVLVAASALQCVVAAVQGGPLHRLGCRTHCQKRRDECLDTTTHAVNAAVHCYCLLLVIHTVKGGTVSASDNSSHANTYECVFWSRYVPAAATAARCLQAAACTSIH